jgi:hypothetical protein
VPILAEEPEAEKVMKVDINMDAFSSAILAAVEKLNAANLEAMKDLVSKSAAPAPKAKSITFTYDEAGRVIGGTTEV